MLLFSWEKRKRKEREFSEIIVSILLTPEERKEIFKGNTIALREVAHGAGDIKKYVKYPKYSVFYDISATTVPCL